MPMTQKPSIALNRPGIALSFSLRPLPRTAT
jgi:hypothetical protein